MFPLLRAARQIPGSEAPEAATVPVWFMRQAGRSLPEYREVRGEGTILHVIADTDRATEITLQPVRRYGVDAAILYSDIVTPVWAVDFGIDIVPGVGPMCEHPFESASDLDRLRPLEPDVDLPYQAETIKNVVADGGVPLIGFAGGPFTLASYLVEGRPSRTYTKVKALMFGQPELWHQLCELISDLAIATLKAQVAAGASMVQLFDSWAGALRPEHYIEYVLPHSTRILSELGELGVPRTHFGITTGELLGLMADAGADVVGVDWRTPLSVARDRTGGRVALQGNLDPALTTGTWDVIEREVRRVLDDNDAHPGHIFNLGHGVMPESDPGLLKQVVDLVHEEGRC
ncbi:MAG: uroporphyrinogen decarboxylase [Acidimicrobiales bacterium]